MNEDMIELAREIGRSYLNNTTLLVALLYPLVKKGILTEQDVEDSFARIDDLVEDMEKEQAGNPSALVASRDMILRTLFAPDVK